MILLIDHFDSFVETLARYARESGAATHVLRVDDLVAADVAVEAPQGIILSPGPGQPSDTPETMALFELLPETPILGVCLGHQALCQAYGGATVPAPHPMHGRASQIHHEGGGLFADIPSPFPAGKYHSLLGTLPEDGPLDALAWDEEGTLMAARHRTQPHFGVQFHPESLLTPAGRIIMRNFLSLTDKETA
ncbi:anthranilate synthase component II [Parvularcula marina]|uniref:Aminodeoxychorismate/anthranilate synthase component II n=1 Tax=Parvularcula marina TaxID=2292771 RepID=A0A371RJZ3_9PROT|nr:aminodeoxychorismate/anthranilate synthase component II [Parvularcula marina]RFB05771.1 aminodeoxychorismate/anthranilate synthase component II [Parvularcula marina]